MNANGLRENSRVQVCISQVLLTLPITIIICNTLVLNLNVVLTSIVSEILCANSNITDSGHIWDHNKKTTQGREHKAAMTQRLWEEEVTVAAWCFSSTLWLHNRETEQQLERMFRGFLSLWQHQHFKGQYWRKQETIWRKMRFRSNEDWNQEISQAWKLNNSSKSNLPFNKWNYPCENSKRFWLT